MNIYLDEELFEWMYQLVGGKRYYKLLTDLHNTEFVSAIATDENRVMDGVNVRYAFADEAGIAYSTMDKKFNRNHASILEVMVGLSMRIENTIMSDADFGDRTTMWFWMMVKSLGLYDNTDDNYDEEYTREVLLTFLDRDYSPNGSGSLFTVKNASKDMRNIEIWYQMCLFYDSIM